MAKEERAFATVSADHFNARQGFLAQSSGPGWIVASLADGGFAARVFVNATSTNVANAWVKQYGTSLRCVYPWGVGRMEFAAGGAR